MPAMIPLLQILRLRVKGLRRCELRAGALGARGRGEHLKVHIGRHQHDHIPRASIRQASGRHVMAFGSCVVDGRQIECGLSNRHACVKHVIRSNHAWKTRTERKSECLEVGLASRFRKRGIDFRQQIAERDKPGASRVLESAFSLDGAEVVVERPVNRIGD